MFCGKSKWPFSSIFTFSSVQNLSAVIWLNTASGPPLQKHNTYYSSQVTCHTQNLSTTCSWWSTNKRIVSENCLKKSIFPKFRYLIYNILTLVGGSILKLRFDAINRISQHMEIGEYGSRDYPCIGECRSRDYPSIGECGIRHYPCIGECGSMAGVEITRV